MQAPDLHGSIPARLGNLLINLFLDGDLHRGCRLCLLEAGPQVGADHVLVHDAAGLGAHRAELVQPGLLAFLVIHGVKRLRPGSRSFLGGAVILSGLLILSGNLSWWSARIRLTAPQHFGDAPQHACAQANRSPGQLPPISWGS